MLCGQASGASFSVWSAVLVVNFMDAFRCQSFDRFGVLSFLHQLKHLMVDGGSDRGVRLVSARATLVRTLGHASHRFLAKVDPITFGCPEEEVSHPIRGVEGEVFPPPPPEAGGAEGFWARQRTGAISAQIPYAWKVPARPIQGCPAMYF